MEFVAKASNYASRLHEKILIGSIGNPQPDIFSSQPERIRVRYTACIKISIVTRHCPSCEGDRTDSGPVGIDVCELRTRR